MCLCKIKFCLLLCKLTSHIIGSLLHYQSLLASHTRTSLRTRATTGTVCCRNGNCKIHARYTHHRNHLHAFRSLLYFFLRHGNRTNYRMRTNHRATITLNTIFRNPLWHINRYTSALVCGSTTRSSTICIISKCRNREFIAALCIYFLLNLLNKLQNFRSVSQKLCSLHFIYCISPIFRNFYFHHAASAGINSVVVHLNNCITLLTVALLCSILHILNGIFCRNNICQSKECGL